MSNDYYQQSAHEYARRSLQADIGALYEPFLARVPAGGRILDVGCGAGRDLAIFCARGFAAEGIEPSPALAQIARQHSGAPVRIVQAQALADEAIFAGVWACASLLHVPRMELSDVLARLSRALVPGGVLWASFKEGAGHMTEKGPTGGTRVTELYSEAELLALLAGVPELELLAIGHNAEQREAGLVSWINLLARRMPADLEET